MCDPNINTLSDVIFANIGDEFNWTNNASTPVSTNAGRLQLKPDSATTYFNRVLGVLDVSNNRIKLKINMRILRPQGSPSASSTILFGVYDGATLLGQYSVYVDGLTAGNSVEYNLERDFSYNNLNTEISLKITAPEGYQNTILLDYLVAQDYNYCEDNIRSYFILDSFLESTKTAQSAAVILKEWKIDGVETLTPVFFSENNSPGSALGANNGFKLALANLDGSGRAVELTNPNTFNPFVEEWGLDFNDIPYHGGKATAPTSGNNYGAGILTVGVDKPIVLNGNLEAKNGAFFIDIDYSKDLLVVFDAIINNRDKDNVFNSPFYIRRYYIKWSVATCSKEFYYVNQLTPYNTVDQIVNGFLYGLTPGLAVTNAVACNQSFDYNGTNGVYEFLMDFGNGVGEAGINYDASQQPDKFEIEWDGQIITTGYVGSSTFNQQLINAGVNPSEINTAPAPGNGAGTLVFNKTTPTPSTAIVRVTAPLTGTYWRVVGICPRVNTPKPAVIGKGNCQTTPINWDNIFLNVPVLENYIPQVGDVIYTNQGQTIPYVGTGTTYRIRVGNFPYQSLLAYTIVVNNVGVITEVYPCLLVNQGIRVTNQTDTNCRTCFTVEAVVPQGESRDVKFLSDFAPGGAYSVDACIGDINSIFLNANGTYTINQTTKFVLGIDGSRVGGMAIDESTILVSLLSGATVLGEVTLSRSHTNSNC